MKKLLLFMAVAVMSLYGYVSFVEYTGSAGMSELMLENVEALAQGEGGNYGRRVLCISPGAESLRRQAAE